MGGSKFLAGASFFPYMPGLKCFTNALLKSKIMSYLAPYFLENNLKYFFIEMSIAAVCSLLK